MDRIALVSDPHGNLTAWNAVLADIAAQGISTIYCLGDLAGKGPHGAEVVDSCREVCAGVVRGNWDETLARGDRADDELLAWTRAQLGDERLDYLGALPNCIDIVLSGKRVRLYHASAQGVYHRVFPDAPEAELRAMFANTDFTGHDHPEPTIICYGDLHAVFLVDVDHLALINVGSAGNPLDGTLAGYAVLEGVVDEPSLTSWSVSFRHVPYDVDAAVDEARAADMPAFEAYAIELRTGVYRGFHAEQGLTLDR